MYVSTKSVDYDNIILMKYYKQFLFFISHTFISDYLQKYSRYIDITKCRT